jgi:hypothetical protein
MCWALASRGPSLSHLPSQSYKKSIQLIANNVCDVYGIYALVVITVIDVVDIILQQFARVYPSNFLGKALRTLERFERVTTLNTRRDIACQRQLSNCGTVCNGRSPLFSYYLFGFL